VLAERRPATVEEYLRENESPELTPSDLELEAEEFPAACLLERESPPPTSLLDLRSSTKRSAAEQLCPGH